MVNTHQTSQGSGAGGGPPRSSRRPLPPPLSQGPYFTNGPCRAPKCVNQWFATCLSAREPEFARALSWQCIVWPGAPCCMCSCCARDPWQMQSLLLPLVCHGPVFTSRSNIRTTPQCTHMGPNAHASRDPGPPQFYTRSHQCSKDQRTFSQAGSAGPRDIVGCLVLWLWRDVFVKEVTIKLCAGRQAKVYNMPRGSLHVDTSRCEHQS